MSSCLQSNPWNEKDSRNTLIWPTHRLVMLVSGRFVWLLALLLLFGCTAKQDDRGAQESSKTKADSTSAELTSAKAPSQSDSGSQADQETVRFATFNVAMNRNQEAPLRESLNLAIPQPSANSPRSFSEFAQTSSCSTSLITTRAEKESRIFKRTFSVNRKTINSPSNSSLFIFRQSTQVLIRGLTLTRTVNLVLPTMPMALGNFLVSMEWWCFHSFRLIGTIYERFKISYGKTCRAFAGRSIQKQKNLTTIRRPEPFSDCPLKVIGTCRFKLAIGRFTFW